MLIDTISYIYIYISYTYISYIYYYHIYIYYTYIYIYISGFKHSNRFHKSGQVPPCKILQGTKHSSRDPKQHRSSRDLVGLCGPTRA